MSLSIEKHTYQEILIWDKRLPHVRMVIPYGYPLAGLYKYKLNTFNYNGIHNE